MFPEIVSDFINQVMVLEEGIQPGKEILYQQVDKDPLMIWKAGSNILYYYFNKVWLEFTGQQLTTGLIPEEISNAWVFSVHPEDRQECEEIFYRAIAVYSPFNRQYRLRRADGEYRWVLELAAPRFAGDGSFIGYIGYCVDITDVTLKKTIQTQQSEDRLRISLNQAHMGMWDWELATGKINWAYGTDALFGINLAELAGTYEAFLNCTHSEDRKLLTEAMYKSVTEGSECDFEIRMIWKDATFHWIRVQGTVLRDESGKSVQMIGTVTDITQRKLAQLELEQANQSLRDTLEKQTTKLTKALEQLQRERTQNQKVASLLSQKTSQLEKILQLIPDLYFCFDAEGNILNYKPGKTVSLSISEEVVRVQQILESLPESVRSRFQEAIHQVLTINSLVSFEYTLPLPEGNRHFNASLLPLQEGQTIVLIRDISNTNIEVKFRTLTQRQKLLNQLSAQIRASLELDAILETAVQEIYKLVQVDRCSFIWYRQNAETPYWEVVSEVKKPELPSLLGSKKLDVEIGLLATNTLRKEKIQINDIETEKNHAIQQFFRELGYTAFLALPIHTQVGEIGVLTCSHSSGPRPWLDSEVELLQAVTDKMAIAIDQAMLHQQNRIAVQIAQDKAQQLEAALEELSSTQAQLIQNEKMSSLGQLVAGVAHEINNPVNFIYGNIIHASEYIRDLLHLVKLYQQHYSLPTPEIRKEIKAIDLDFLSQDLPKILDSMNMGAERVRQIVSSLRNYSRLDAGMKPVDIHEGIDNTLLLLQNRLKAKQGQPEIKVIKEYGDLPLVNCYPAQLNQVFMNLLVNAIDALEESLAKGEIMENPSIRIRTCIYQEDQVMIRIADNGPGMTPEVRNRLFNTFFTTKPIGKGTGMGLSISHQIIVDKHCGQLECISELGQGAEFVIIIPL